MLGIVICDDDRFTLDLSVRLAERSLSGTEGARVVCATTDYSEAIRFLEKNPGAYLYFLDIDFGRKPLNGLDVAKIIKGREPLSKVVFVTGHPDLGIKVLKSGAEAFGFIEKTADPERMLSGYRKYVRLAAGSAPRDEGACGERSVRLLVGIDEYVSFPVSQILYAEAVKTVSHFVCYRTVDGSEVSVRDTIENALESLGSGFMKSHRSVVINISLAVSVSDGLVRFAGGETAACSYRLRNDVIKKCGLGRGGRNG